MKEYSASKVLKLTFWVFSLAFFIGAVAAPDRASMLSGLVQLITNPTQLTTDSFAIGGVAATFFNTGLMGVICCILMCIPGYAATSASAIGYFLTVGFSFWGINPVNALPCMLGAFLFAALRKERAATAVNFAMFATALAPLVSDLFLRYPGLDNHGFTALSIVLGIAVGCLVGLLTAMGCAHSPNVHKGYALYSAALPMGILAFVLRALLYNTLGAELPPIEATLSEGYMLLCNIFCIVLFVLCLAAGFVLNGRSFSGYLALLKDSGYKVDYSAKYGPGLALMNLGIFGLFVMLYYNLVGATWTGVTIGVVFCMVSVCIAGSNPRNVLPIMIGYVLMSFVGVNPINAQAIVVGLCFANGLSPIIGQYGYLIGVVVGALHYSIVTSVPAIHGGFCLYNGGFTCCLLCIVVVPVLEKLCKSRSEKEAEKLAAAESLAGSGES